MRETLKTFLISFRRFIVFLCCQRVERGSYQVSSGGWDKTMIKYQFSSKTNKKISPSSSERSAQSPTKAIYLMKTLKKRPKARKEEENFQDNNNGKGRRRAERTEADKELWRSLVARTKAREKVFKDRFLRYRNHQHQLGLLARSLSCPVFFKPRNFLLGGC